MLYALCVFYTPLGVPNAYAYRSCIHGSCHYDNHYIDEDAFRITHNVDVYTCTWNRGFTATRQVEDIEDLLTHDNNFDIICATETFLDHTIPDSKIIKNFTLYRRDRNRNGKNSFNPYHRYCTNRPGVWLTRIRLGLCLLNAQRHAYNLID